jgi:hypothetical protein
MIRLNGNLTIRRDGKSYEGKNGEQIDLADVFDIDQQQAFALETRYIDKFPGVVVRIQKEPSVDEEEGSAGDESSVDEGEDIDIEKLTKSEIMEHLDELEIEYSSSASKADLLKLLEESVKEKE